MKLYEILVPCTMHPATSKGEVRWHEPERPVRVAHHRVWDRHVQEITGGLTIGVPQIGIWQPNGETVFRERMIPVRIACSQEQIAQIAEFTLSHYRQRAVMYYLVSNQVFIVERKNV